MSGKNSDDASIVTIATHELVSVTLSPSASDDEAEETEATKIRLEAESSSFCHSSSVNENSRVWAESKLAGSALRELSRSDLYAATTEGGAGHGRVK